MGWGGVEEEAKSAAATVPRHMVGEGGGREGGDDHLPKTNNKQINDANRN